MAIKFRVRWWPTKIDVFRIFCVGPRHYCFVAKHECWIGVQIHHVWGFEGKKQRTAGLCKDGVVVEECWQLRKRKSPKKRVESMKITNYSNSHTIWWISFLCNKTILIAKLYHLIHNERRRVCNKLFQNDGKRIKSAWHANLIVINTFK